MAEVIKIRFEYTDYMSDKTYKFDITHDRHYGCKFQKTKQAYKDFLHYCNTNERLYNLGKDINRFEKITLIRKTGGVAYIYILGEGIFSYTDYLAHENKKKEKQKKNGRYKLPSMD